jgi:hypothetical protein
LTGGTIELWNNLNNVKATDGVNFDELDFRVLVTDSTSEDRCGAELDLSVDACSRLGFNGLTCSGEVSWNDTVVATAPPGAAGIPKRFSVTGLGGQDRLTFREVAGQGADGLGAL